MRTPDDVAEDIASLARDLAGEGRKLIAVAGPPAAGKSTVAEAVANTLGPKATLVPMDGFHFSNAILDARGLRARKGAPETFDLAGFKALLSRMRTESEVAVPTFDRALDCSIGSSVMVEPHHDLIVVEGNYLLLDEPNWRELAGYWDASAFLNVPFDTLKARLIQRWLDHGLGADAAEHRAMSNDIPNALRVVENVLPADLIVEG